MSTTTATTATYRSESIMQKRVRNFKKIRRAYYSLLIIGILYLLSFFAPIIINNKALAVHYNGSTHFPAFADLFGGVLPVAYHDATYYGQTVVFDEPINGEAHYRELKKTYAAENKGNWVIMPPYPYSPIEILIGKELNAEPPSSPDKFHWFGTDNIGRDVFARVVYGFFISISFALVVVTLGYILGIAIGATLGYYGGKIDVYGMRFIEVLSLIPFMFVIMILASFIKPSFFLLALLLVVLGGWISVTFYIRGEYYREKAKDYVSAAIAMGASDARVMFQHILPNALTPVISNAPFAMIGGISSLVALDFLGFGLRPPTPSWGEMIGQGLAEISTSWWLILTPLSLMFFTLITITFIGEGVRQAFDPREYSRLQ